MKQLEKSDRDQLMMASLEMFVQADAMVRVIDVFLDFALKECPEFKVNKNRTTGRPSYPVRSLLGIYIYGYLHKLRSSRELQRACLTNVEVWWLIHEHKPCYKTICNFRKDNKAGFEKLFVSFRKFCKELELFGRQTIAIDGTKVRAQNSKKNNFNIKKVNDHLAYIADQEAYLDTLDNQDEIDERQKKLKKRKAKYKKIEKILHQTQDTQISTIDPDARALPLHMNIVEVGYNIQAAVDDKHNLIVDYEVTNVHDTNALAPMAKRTQVALDIRAEEQLTVLADKGYYKAEQIAECHASNIETLVSPRFIADTNKADHVRKDKFQYDTQKDQYKCPQGEILEKQARYKRRKKGKVVGEFDRYAIKYSICKDCPNFNECVTPSQQKSSQGRTIDRSIYEHAIDRNNEEIAKRRNEYKRRQAIVEHPFGTIKRQWGMYYTLLRTQPKVQTEYSIVLLCYNLRRVMSIIGLKDLKMALKRAFFSFLIPRSVIVAHIDQYKIKSPQLSS